MCLLVFHVWTIHAVFVLKLKCSIGNFVNAALFHSGAIKMNLASEQSGCTVTSPADWIDVRIDIPWLLSSS